MSWLAHHALYHAASFRWLNVETGHPRAGPVPMLATVAAKGGGFIAQVKARSDVEIVMVTLANRDSLPDELSHRIQAR